MSVSASQNTAKKGHRLPKKRSQLVPPENFDAMADAAILRPEQIAALLGISLSSFWRLVDRGELKTLKLSERITGVTAGNLREFIAQKGA